MEYLYHQLTKTSERVRQLEDALSELQAKHSTELHPLLRPELLGASEHDDSVGPPSTHDPAVAENTPELVEALGTWSISDSGVSHFFGPTGGSHCLLMIDSEDFANNSSDSARDSKSLQLPQEIENLSLAFPFKPDQSSLNVENLVKAYLPTWRRARYLAEVYLDQVLASSLSVSKDHILSELLPAYYTGGVPHVAQAGINPHQLSLLLLIFAVGALLDPKQEPGNVWAEFYHRVARAAICLQSVIDQPSLETIQALRLLSIYNSVSGNELAGKETSIQTSWSLVALAAPLALRLGLHRDGLKWGLPDDITTTRRRLVFWELFVADVWDSLDSGRPPTLSLPYIDCQFPGGGSPHDKVHIGSDSRSWVFRFASYCVADVAARTLTSNPPSYSIILELDRKVSNFPVTPAAEEFAAAACGDVPAKPAGRDIPFTESVIRLIMSNAREVVLLHIHRSYFVQAIIEYPTNPLQSPYTPSFLASYRASLTILRTIRLQYDLHPKLTAGLWRIWTYAFSAAIVFGTIVTHGPRSLMASSAMKELRDAHILFSKASSHSRRAQEALPIITKLMGKAENALFYARSDMPHELGQQWGVPDDTAAIFAGRTKIVFLKRQMTDRTSERSLNSDGSARQSRSSALVPQQQQSQVEPTVLQSYSREQLGLTGFKPSSSAAGVEQMQEVSTWDRTLYPGTSSQSTLIRPPRAPPQIPPHVPYSGEQSGSTWLQQPGFTAGLEPTQEMPTSDRTHYPDTSSWSTLIQPPRAPLQTPHAPYSGEQSGPTWLQQPDSTAGRDQTLTWDPRVSSQSMLTHEPVPLRAPQQIPPYIPSEASAHGGPVAGPSTGPWQSELYSMTNLSAPSAQTNFQGYHPDHHRHDQHEHCPLTHSASSTVSYYGHALARTGVHYHQSHPQPHTSTYPRTDTQPQPLSGQCQPIQWHSPQFQPEQFAPPKLTQLGLVPQGLGLAQQWTSFMRDSGFFDGCG